jgi:hypothetical protein
MLNFSRTGGEISEQRMRIDEIEMKWRQRRSPLASFFAHQDSKRSETRAGGSKNRV